MHKLDILILEDDELDVELIRNELDKTQLDYSSRIAINKKQFLKALKENKPDLILADYNLPDFTGFDALKITKQIYSNTPFIIVTGSIAEETAAESIMKGAWDYIVKERIYRLKSAIEGSLKLQKERQEKMMALKRLKQNEVKYRELYNFFRLMADTVPDLIWAKDMKKRFTFTNQAMCDILLNAKDTEEPIGKTDLFFAERERKNHPENKKWHTFGEVCQDSDEVIFRTKKPRKFDEFGNVKGKFIFLEVYKAPIFDDQNKMIGTVGSARDITQRKRAQRQIERDLQEKKIMLTEIHHRVKNNLQVITSMLRMEKNKMQSELDKKVLLEIFTRIKTMSNIHEILYRSENFYDIEFNDFIDKIVADLYMLYNMSSKKIEIEKQIEKLTLDINHAIPVGLIINELVSNVFKYAIPEQGKCHLKIIFCKKGNEYMLGVIDDGKGIGEDIEISKIRSTGLRLVYLLSEQLRSKYEISTEKGTKIIIKFKKGGLSSYSKL